MTTRDKDHSTEEIILDAAREVFMEKGMEGARMQEIADAAGINKALLHYYFRTKEKLFGLVFDKAFGEFLPRMTVLFSSDIPLLEKLSQFIRSYIELISKNRFLPGFMITEINRDPGKVVEKFQQMASGMLASNIRILEKELKNEEKKGNIKYVDPRHLIVNILALCIFPYIGEPLLKPVLFANDSSEFSAFMEERPALIEKFVLNALKP